MLDERAIGIFRYKLPVCFLPSVVLFDYVNIEIEGQGRPALLSFDRIDFSGPALDIKVFNVGAVFYVNKRTYITPVQDFAALQNNMP